MDNRFSSSSATARGREEDDQMALGKNQEIEEIIDFTDKKLIEEVKTQIINAEIPESIWTAENSELVSEYRHFRDLLNPHSLDPRCVVGAIDLFQFSILRLWYSQTSN